jgi:hypothetical protein
MRIASRRAYGLVALSVVLLLGVGYVSAFVRVPECKNAFVQDLNEHHVTGWGFPGPPVAPRSADVVGSAWPFIVDVSLDLPLGMHGATYSARYLALPWGISQISRDVIRYV